MFLRFFHTVLILSYFFCCHSEIIAAPFISSLGERAFKPLKSNSHPRTQTITSSLPKHIHTVFQIQIDIDNLHVSTAVAPIQPVFNFYFVACADEIPHKYFETPLNKAPPAFSF